MSTTSTNMDAHIQALPQELQDEILNFTLVAMLPAKHIIETENAKSKTSNKLIKVTKISEPQENTQDNESGLMIVDQDYKSPAGLQINRKTRAVFAKILYGGMAIYLTDRQCDLAVTDKWLHSIDRKHFKLLLASSPSPWESRGLPFSFLAKPGHGLPHHGKAIYRERSYWL